MDKVALRSVTRTVQEITWNTVVSDNSHIYFAYRSVMWVGLSGAAAFGITWAGVEPGVFWTLPAHWSLVWTLVLLVPQIPLVVFKKPVDVSQEYPGGKQDGD